MKVEIWSDVVCPFCYIGKTKFENALENFKDKGQIEIEWRSFQLMPDMVTRLDKNIDQVLSESKGIPLNQARQMNAQVTQMAKQIGLVYNFDKAIVPNTFLAHQFIQFAQSKGKQNQAEELMFKSYFTDGKNLDDKATLLELGKSIGLNESELQSALEKQTFASQVKADIDEANQLGVRGVPFFVFNRKYAVSGAQDSQVFLNSLEKSFSEWRRDNPVHSLEMKEGPVCSPDKKCD